MQPVEESGSPGAVKQLNGRDALPRVRSGNPIRTRGTASLPDTQLPLAKGDLYTFALTANLNNLVLDRKLNFSDNLESPKVVE